MMILVVNLLGAPLHDPNLPGVFGGGEVDLYMMARLFARLGHEVHVLVRGLAGEAEREVEGIRLHALFPDGRAGRRPAQMLAGWRALSRLRPELLVAEIISDQSAVAGAWGRLHGVPLLYRAANQRDWLLVAEPGRYGWWERARFRLTLAGLHTYVAQTREQAEVIRRVVPEERLRVIPNFHLPQEQALPEFGRRSGILWVGHLTRVKQPRRVAELARRLPGIPFTVVAPTQAHAEEPGSREALALPNVTLLDSVPFREIQPLYNQARVLLNTSLSEGFPNTFIHAMHGGTPLAAVDVDPDRIFREGGCGIQEPDLARLAAGLERLHDDEALWRGYRSRVEAWREQRFAFAPVEAAYREILAAVEVGIRSTGSR